VELDGAHRFSLIGQELDAMRDLYLKEKGIVVLRFENRDVFEDLELVLGVIRENFQKI
jgi:very-short-patch-repair endonuclease